MTIISDHKPLEIINKKQLLKSPKRLQRIFLALQEYDLHIKWEPGKNMLIADQLSRCNPTSANTENSFHGNFIHMIDIEETNAISDLPISSSKIQDLKSCTETDDQLKIVVNYT